MAFSTDNFVTLFEHTKKIYELLPLPSKKDTLAKSTLLAYLISQYSLLNYFEYGSEIGESFLLATYAMAKNNGHAHATCAREEREAFFYQKNILVETIKKFSPSGNAIFIEGEGDLDNFFQNNEGIDLLNINGREIETQGQMEKIVGAIHENGFIVCDTSLFDTFTTYLKQLKRRYVVFLETKDFFLFQIGSSVQELSVLEKKKFENLYSMLENTESNKNVLVEKQPFPIISVIVIAYNQEKYIAECLQGIFAQKGSFQLELVIGDDASQDTTHKIIQDYIANFGGQVIIKDISSSNNVGMTRNFQHCLNACTGDFIAVCEGDDYWIDPLKLQRQIRFLTEHPNCSVCFNRIYVYFQNTNKFWVFEPDTKFVGNIFKTRDLVLEYFIGNLSCCMYDAKYISQIRTDLFDMFIGDWMFNIYYSQFGEIGYLEDVMSIYRKHDDGIWGNKTSQKKARFLQDYIREYNKFLNFEFDYEFSLTQKKIKYAIDNALYDVAIIDDVSPHPLSAFRMQEFLSYMKVFENLIVHCSGISIHLLGDKSLDELIRNFSKKYPQYASQIDILRPSTTINAKLIYTVFLGNTYININEIESSETPFAFCLYPGGMFGLNNEYSDKMLKRVTSSPCFRKVIVTQKITYDYLIEKKYCTHEQIEFIFGVVTPLEQLERDYVGKKHYGIDKDTLDICFVAHKYTEKGIDKGYDVFVAVATALSQKYQNIRFHVVGGFDENVLDVNHLQGKIKFYGNQEIEWFDEFYLDKDIILSPNIPFKIFEGSFDGFPTGSCTDAGLRETAIFCTDELKLNDGFFVDGEEIVIIPHNIQDIIKIIEFYYHQPEKLRKVAKNGRKKIKELYGYDAQILPRINLLQTEVELFEHNKSEILKKFASILPFRKRLSRLAKKVRRLSSMFFAIIRENTPSRVKNNLKRILPSFVVRIYERFLA